MKRNAAFTLSLMLSCAVLLWASGIIPAIIPAAVPVGNKVGNSAKFQLAATSGPTSGDCASFDASLNITGAGTGSGCGSSAANANGITVYSGLASVALTGTIFFPAGGGSTASATEADVKTPTQAATTVSAFGVNLSAALGQTIGVDNIAVFTWRKNASSQTLTCTITNPQTSCADTTHSFTTAVADLIDIQVVFTGTIPVTPVFVMAAVMGVTVTGPTGPTGPTGAAGSSGFGNYYQPNVATTGAALTALPTSGWTIRNSAVLNDFSIGSTQIFIPDNGSANLRGITRTITVPYTIYAALSCKGANVSVAAQICGIYITDATKYEGLEFVTTTGTASFTRVQQWNSVTSAGSAVAGPTSNVIGSTFAVKIENNSTNRIYSYFSNGAWVQLLSEASGTFLTETGAGPLLLSNASNNGTWLEGALLFWNVQ